MKKSILFACLIMLSLLITGCGEKNTKPSLSKTNNTKYEDNKVTVNPQTSTPTTSVDTDKKQPKKDDFKIVANEASSVNFVSYSDPSGYFNAEIPKGWSVKVGLPDGGVDLISYAITIYDPKNTDRMVYINLSVAGMTKSSEAKEWYTSVYGTNSPQALLPTVYEQTTEGYFMSMGSFYGYRNFSVSQNLGKCALQGDVIIGNSTSASTGNPLTGVYHAYVTDIDYPIYPNPFDYSYTIDAGYLTVFTVIMETAGADEFIDWEPVLSRCLSSITFTKTFETQRAAQWKQVMGTSQYLAQSANQMSSAIMDSWEKRNTSYDISSQKYSDATLGYERVYDKETGNIYKAYNGFMDDYNGTRYVTISDDQYALAVSGYIEK